MIASFGGSDGDSRPMRNAREAVCTIRVGGILLPVQVQLYIRVGLSIQGHLTANCVAVVGRGKVESLIRAQICDRGICGGKGVTQPGWNDQTIRTGGDILELVSALRAGHGRFIVERNRHARQGIAIRSDRAGYVIDPGRCKIAIQQVCTQAIYCVAGGRKGIPAQ
jgi:hypothetical protein